MAIIFRNAGLGEGISTAGSALGDAFRERGRRAYEKQQKDQEFRRQQNLELVKKEELAKSGSILQDVLSGIGQNPSVQQLSQSYASYIEQGGDPEIGKQVFSKFDPSIKQEAQTQGIQPLIQQLFGPQGQMTPDQQAMSQGQMAPDQQDMSQNGALDGALGMDAAGGNVLPQGQMAPPQQAINQGLDISNVPESKLVAATGVGHPEIAKMAQTELQRRDLEQKRYESQRKYESELSTPFLKKVDESRDSVRQKESALELMQGAIQEGDLAFFSKDHMANLFGQFGEGLRTAKGAQLLNAQKEFLLGNIQRAGSRPNQWIEQQISTMLPQTGRNREANLTVVEALKAETDLERKKIQVTDEISQRYRDSIGYVPANIGSLVDSQMVPFAKETQDKLSYRLRTIHEKEIGKEQMSRLVGRKVEKGTPLTLNMAKNFIGKYGDVDKSIKNAKKLGYTIPTADEVQRWQR